ncbi:hypothetical protein VFPPC_17496 [Pochonia chlamydosporia 170]|uniref:Uncharacterized protein n=1 Tax=Pochonia chlamydosporia 170 TaxID=1380566 RepID=A0A219ARF0_METCM|nr:hypothetical protein VFPPC_17496 [Pochonia chlamydosporia 170]OWT43341.1 hypothetical protein VFPPC_17496 [Pochonia chlamydosporia 170]
MVSIAAEFDCVSCRMRIRWAKVSISFCMVYGGHTNIHAQQFLRRIPCPIFMLICRRILMNFANISAPFSATWAIGCWGIEVVKSIATCSNQDFQTTWNTQRYDFSTEFRQVREYSKSLHWWFAN